VGRGDFAPGFVAPRPRRLDLPAIVRRQLERAGIRAVAGRGECTMCHTRAVGRWTFHTYRRDRETRTPVVVVHWSAIAIAHR
jgi:copper oxidase (laccase) domain-containing protein